MSENPWLGIRLEDYEKHMSHQDVFQLQTLNHITKAQIETFISDAQSDPTVAILGVASGNGLEHCLRRDIKSVIGVDINPEYLLACRQAYANILPNFQLFCLDLVEDCEKAVGLLKNVDLLIANLLIEHIHLSNFIRIISGIKKHVHMVSCVIQNNPDGETVSQSGHEKAFTKLAPLIEESESKAIISAMTNIGFRSSFSRSFGLPNGKALIRLDFRPIS